MSPASPTVYTIPPHRPFSDTLVTGLLAQHGRDPLAFARGLLLVPNNRAARAITDAFVRHGGGGLLLPRLVPVGDPELDERIGGALDPAGVGEPIAPAVEPMERLLVLARLIQQTSPGTGASEAFRLAADLARTLDQLIIERIDPARLGDAAADVPDLSAHWQKSLAKLELILGAWPQYLRGVGKIDLAERRNHLLDALVRRWRVAPPEGFVVAAGITTTAPAVAAVLRAVARLPRGAVVLPALDLAMPRAEWESLGPHDPDPVSKRAPRSTEGHPQFHLKLLLDRMSVGRGEVERWPWRGGGGAQPRAVRGARAVRTRAINHAMAPAHFTGKWQTLPPPERRLTGVRALEAAGPAAEAQIIAVALREAIDTPGETAALVTPDRDLARRVSAHLARWGIEADDSAGRPLAQTPPGTLLVALATAAVERFAPVALLTLLKHPLVAAGEGRRQWLDGVRALDLALRGPRPAAGLAGIDAHLAIGDERNARKRAAALAWWPEARTLLARLETAFAGPLSLAEILAVLRETASALTGEAAWSGFAGRAAAELIAEAEAAASLSPPELGADSIVPILAQLMGNVAVRPPYGGHPRIFIWGLLEARLQHADLMILAGLNEGSWPSLPQPDAWLAPRIRANLGLPGLERRIGLAAHDFATALGGRRVLVTRARRDARAPATASRLWLRLEAMTGGMTRAPQLCRWAEAIDKPGHAPRPAERPRPCPPAAQRPKSINVTEVDRLKADPFAFYAKAMLRLAALDPPDAEPGPAWKGTAVHAVLQAWMDEDACTAGKLRPRAEAFLAEAHPLLRTLWRPRLLEAIDFIERCMEEKRAEGRRPWRAEVRGGATLAGIDIAGRADRIDRLADDSLAIVDYKTGKPPSPKQIRDGFALQLGLLGAIAEAGGFEGVAGEAGCFEYWSLARKKSGDGLGFVASPLKEQNAAEFVEQAVRDFECAARKWLLGEEPFTAKLQPDYAFGEYDQLMRQDEWYYGRGAAK